MTAPGDLARARGPSAAATRCYERLARDVTASICSRRCVGSRAPTPTSRDSATRVRPGDEPIRFAAGAVADLRAGAAAAFEQRRDKPPRLVQRVFGFLGPNGALPTHLTEFARERAGLPRRPDVRSLPRHPAASLRPVLLSRLGEAHPEVGLDRPADAPVVRHVGAADRHRSSLRRATATRSATCRSCSSPAGSRARFATPTACEAWLRLQFDVPVRVEQCQGHWMPLGREERTRLQRDGQCGVGRGAVLGRAVFDVQHKFRIAIGSLAWPRFATLLPGNNRSTSRERWSASTSASSLHGTCG